MTATAVIDDLLRTLADSKDCRVCRNLWGELHRSRVERNVLARKLATNPVGRDFSERREARLRDLLGRAEDYLAAKVASTDEHLAEPHEAPALRAAPARRKPVAKVDDRPLCPRCGKRVTPHDGRIRAHSSPRGVPCRGGWLEPVKVPLPPVTFPTRPAPPVRRAVVSEGRPDAERVATGRCHDCDRRISGERRYCGRCAARRM